MAPLTQTPQIANQDDNLFVAREIITQLGGDRFLRVSGCHGLLGCAGYTKEHPHPWLRLELRPGGKENRQRLLITLMPNDLYRMDFYTPRRVTPDFEVKMDWEHYTHVYADTLRVLFTKATGFATA